MPASFPEQNFNSGWPESVLDIDGKRYVRVRDGSPTGPFSGNSCLYARVDNTGKLERDKLWVPVLGSTPDRVSMAGGVWMNPEEAKRLGVPPIVLPAEPVNVRRG